MALESLQPATYAIISIAFAIGTLSILLRLWCRLKLQTFGWDDVVAIFLLFVNAMQQTILYIFLHYGCGLHATLLTPHQLDQITKWLFVEEIYYMFVHWTLKQAFLLFYLRLSPRKSFQMAVYGTMVLNTIFTIVNWLLAFLQCSPFDSIFHPKAYPDAKCMNKYILMMVPSVLNIITDLIILTLPIRTVLSLQMSPRRKAAVLGVICFGAFAVITALCRFLILKQLIVDPDTSYVLGRMVIVAAVEIEIAVVAVNLPAMKSLFTRFAGSSNNRSAEGGSGGLGYKLSSSGYNRFGSSGRKSAGLGSSGQSGQGREGDLVGATLTGSEEELLRRGGGGNIKITTNVEVNSVRAPEEAEERAGDIGLPRASNSRVRSEM